VVVFFVFSNDELYEWFFRNAWMQLALFVPVVELPALCTGHMFYVDIGWPSGLVLLAVNGLYFGTGWWWRKALLGGVFFLHGLRMALGALHLFFPYKFERDIPRYEYAKVRFTQKDGMSAGLWRVKMLHDTLQQAYANCTFLALPLMLSVFNKEEFFHPVEIVGVAMWALCWVWENIADVGKLQFVAKTKEEGVRDAVLGYTPYDTGAYRIWAMCRHPNYFGEWMAWNSIMISSLPSLYWFYQNRQNNGVETWVIAGWVATLIIMSRFFYDCLMYWTGSEPAEHFSVKKRPKYKDYQRTTRVFFPFEMPCVDHCRVEGWPYPEMLENQKPLEGAELGAAS